MKVIRVEKAMKMNCADRVIFMSFRGVLKLPIKMIEVEVGKNRS